MRTDEPQPVRLADYRAPDFTIERVALDVALDADRTVVKAKAWVKRQGAAQAPLVLDGADNLELVNVMLDGRALGSGDYEQRPDSLTLFGVPDAFTLEIETAFSPRANTQLSGVYLSQERIFSQCEAEGFRRITYFLDRPDVLARYKVRVTGDKAKFPFLLSNGDLVAYGDLADGRHWMAWEDPYPKPSYLFALVGGDFDRVDDRFRTASGRDVKLSIFVDKGDAPRAAYALDALKRAMRWDETEFGREYDLDRFMIVAVRDFNFGAMENKGLNIFNSSLLLADPETATDADFEAIESVVAHEYFHNWTGNRITCRDWFQLCLKEGLTVFRDQAFSADQRGEAVQRIKDVKALRARQFVEDAGPLAHPVRPSSFLKIDNFYTATVYEKGAEVIRMLRELIGRDAFRRGMDLYFERCDGTAATVEDFLTCFEATSGRDLSAFLRWYEQAGTPRLSVSSRWDAGAGALDLSVEQRLPATPGQTEKAAQPLPIRLGFVGATGEALPVRLAGESATNAAVERTLTLDSRRASWRFVGLSERPAISILRGLSAPAIIEGLDDAQDRARLAAHDVDAVNRWDAAQAIAREGLVARADDLRRLGGAAPALDAAFVDIAGAAIERAEADPAFFALTILPPDETDVALALDVVDPDAVRRARLELIAAIGRTHEAGLRRLYERFAPVAPFSPDAEQAGRRAARNVALRLLAGLGPEVGGDIALNQLADADNMTDAIAALVALDASGAPQFDAALAAFAEHWRDKPLVIDKWFAVQARSVRPDAVERLINLTRHPDYDEKTPNRARALLGGFAFGNPAAFHAADGRGYAAFTERLAAIDERNPALAARLLGAFETWRTLEPGRRAQAQSRLAAIRDRQGVSPNVYEIASRMLQTSEA